MRATLTATLLFLLVVVPAAGGQEPRIAGFAANLPGSELDDAVWIHNPSAAALPLDGLELSDNSGRIAFPGGAVLPAGATAIVAGNATAWLEAAGNWPDYAIQGLSADRTMRTAKQGFALGQDGDSLSLLDGAEVLDSVAYGDARSLPTGWTGPTVDVAGGNFMRWFPRAAGPDTNAAAEWEGPRRRILGQDTFAPVIVPFSGEVVAFLAPDHARAIVELAFGLASSHLRLNVYELRDLPVAWGLADRLGSRPDLRLDVLVDAAPVGETSAEHNERGHAIRALEEAGATIHVMQHVRYGFDHAKYAVVDERFALVQSENLVPSGIPQDHASGNRGWGVYIANATLARMLAEVFDADFALRPHGARLPSTDDSPTFEPPLTPFYAKPMRGQPLVDSTPGTATLLASPLEPTADDPVVTVLRGARESIRVAQLNFPPVWRDATGRDWPHPYLEAMREAAGRGVRVQALLDGHFLDEEAEGRDNADTAEAIDALPNGEARLQDGDRPVLHAKGLVVDERWVLVGSMNWNLHSMLQNREVDLLLDHPPSARFFAAAFDDDFAAAAPGLDDPVPSAGGLATLLILVLLVRAAKRRTHT